MATRRAPVKKSASAGNSGKPRVIETRMVPIKELKQYHKNPRVGDVDTVAISLDQNGQYKPIVVNVGTHTGRKNEILAGNHTWLGARKSITYTDAKGKAITKDSWDDILASFVDVDEETAKKIVLVDNKSADNGSYDENLLAELLEGMEDPLGTGYLQPEVDDILANLPSQEETQRSLDDIMGNLPEDKDFGLEDLPSERERHMSRESEEKKEAQRSRGASRPEESEDDKDIEDIDVSAELQVILELKEDNIYKGNNAWGIPELRTDMLCEELPGDIQTWGGHEATPDDGKTWWFYNYSLGGRKGLPIDRTILAFNTHDSKFANWWETPAYYTAKYVSEGLKYIVVPDYSFYYSETRAHHLWSVYKAQWMGRFFQEAGLRVIPRLQFDYTDPNSLEIALLGIPKDCPVITTSQQNIENEKEQGPIVAQMLTEALADLNPGHVLFYSGPPGRRAMEAAKFGGKVTYIENYAAVRRNTVFGKKEGSKKLTRKQKDSLIEKHGGKKTAARQFSEDDEADE